MNRSSLKLEFTQKAREFVQNERMSQGGRVKKTKIKKKVPGRSIEKVKERSDIAVRKDTEEVKRKDRKV